MAELKITKDNFEDEVLCADIPVLLDFWAEWCGPCRMLAPTVEKLSEDYEGRLKVGKVNVDEEPELASAFKIDSIPTVLIIKDKTVRAVSLGYKPESALKALIDKEL